MNASQGSAFPELAPTPLEAAVGFRIGVDARAPRLPRHRQQTARSALEAAVLPALIRHPCVVSFSGGRDSSAVLAVASAVARREGLPLPVPVTNVFPDVPEAAEQEFQELVVRHLELPDWQRMVWRNGELDVIGPFAETLFDKVGLVLPMNAHFHVPLLQQAPGGSCLTGIGGDQLLGQQSRTAAAWLVSGHGRWLRPRHLVPLAGQLAPRPVRRLLQKRKHPSQYMSWLTPRAHAEVEDAYARSQADEPLNQFGAIEHWWRSRVTQVEIRQEQAISAAFGTLMLSPLMDPDVVAAVAVEGGFRGIGGRSAAISRLVGDGLPAAARTRRSKASFDGAFWTARADLAGRQWSGHGLDPSLICADRLTSHWALPERDHHSFSLLQQLWRQGDLH